MMSVMADVPQGPDDNAVVLCCLLWAVQGQQEAMGRYEDSVLALVPEHRGTVLQRARSGGGDGRPDEVQLFSFASRSALDGYLQDPRRAALSGERDRVVERTELFPVSLG